MGATTVVNTSSTSLTQIVFEGEEWQRELADRVHALLRASARFFPNDAPIRVPLRILAEHFAAVDPSASLEDWLHRLERALAANPHVFLLEQSEDGLVVVTTRAGKPPLPPEALIDTAHQLPRRFMEPPAHAVVPPQRVQPAESPRAVAEPVAAAAEEEAIATTTSVAPVVEDVTTLTDEQLVEAVRLALRQLPGVVGFGDLWAAADSVPRLSRGDVRRVREYIAERGEPLTDSEILEVIFGVRPGTPEAVAYQLALDAQLATESDFEFVGVPGAHAWTLRDINPVSAPKRRPADIGQDYRYLLDEARDEHPATETVVDHVLTFYEHLYGVLPYDASLAAVLPGRVYPEQTRALLLFEAPQTHETFHVELRYPTGNRGGFLFGLEPFFRANLVAGALITIERTEDPRRFVIDYLPISRQERRLLALDEKQRRYEFRPTTYFCAVQDSMLLTEQRFPRFAGQQPLDERTRRFYERVIEITFERVGENVGTAEAPRYMAALDDLVAAVNVERPLSAERIRSILTSPEFPQFEADSEVEDLFYYTPTQ